MYYSEDVIAEVRQRSDIVDLVSSYVALKRRGRDYVGLCPFHSENRSGSPFTVSAAEWEETQSAS